MEPHTYPLMRMIEDDHWWFVARRRIISTMLARMKIPAAARLLEVGCGTGGNMEMLQAYGRLTCIEPDNIAADLARQRRIAPVLAGWLPNGLPEFTNSFDVVTLLDVIEHIEDDGASLRAVAALLKPGGKILLTVPAFECLWSQHDEENHHKRRYNRKDLERLVQTSGLRLDYLSYFNFWLFPPVAFVRWLRRVFPYNESWRDMKIPAWPANGLLNVIFASERHLLGRISLPFGSSLLGVVSGLPKAA